MSASTDNRRFHSLDQLRSIMMLLGLVIHSAVSFTAKPLGGAWPYQDGNTSVFFDIVVFFIHVFRMPLFFMMAGFFSAYLYNRRGPLVMLRNRTIRVVVPAERGRPRHAAGFTDPAELHAVRLDGAGRRPAGQ